MKVEEYKKAEEIVDKIKEVLEGYEIVPRVEISLEENSDHSCVTINLSAVVSSKDFALIGMIDTLQDMRDAMDRASVQTAG